MNGAWKTLPDNPKPATAVRIGEEAMCLGYRSSITSRPLPGLPLSLPHPSRRTLYHFPTPPRPSSITSPPLFSDALSGRALSGESVGHRGAVHVDGQRRAGQFSTPQAGALTGRQQPARCPLFRKSLGGRGSSRRSEMPSRRRRLIAGSSLRICLAAAAVNSIR